MHIIAELESINKYKYCIFEYPSYFQSNSSSLHSIRSAQRREIRLLFTLDFGVLACQSRPFISPTENTLSDGYNRRDGP
jgi:hypothetical protein